MDNTSNEFYLTGVQLEASDSDVATDFEHRSFGQELALCQRYFCAYGSPIDTISSGNKAGAGMSAASNQAVIMIATGSKMRANPSVSSSNVTVNDAAAGPDIASVSSARAYNGFVQLDLTTNPSNLTTGNAAMLRFESTSYLHFSAEL